MLVQEHPDQKRERVLGQQFVGGGVSGDVKGHATSLALTCSGRDRIP